MTHRHILTCFFFLTLIPLSATAFPPASPAGGNYLTLDGVDDYAVLDFKTHGVLFPKDTEEFTVEMWVYPTTPPAGNVDAMILSQQVRMEVASDNGHWENVKEGIDWQQGDLFLQIRAHIMVKKGVPAEIGRVIALSPNRWHHIAYQSDGRAQANIVNNFVIVRKWPIGWPIAHDLSHFEYPKDFTLGGFGKKIKFPHGDRFRGSFADILMRSVSRQWRVMTSAKTGLRRVINSKKIGIHSRCGILMNRVEDGYSQMHRAINII